MVFTFPCIRSNSAVYCFGICKEFSPRLRFLGEVVFVDLEIVLCCGVFAVADPRTDDEWRVTLGQFGSHCHMKKGLACSYCMRVDRRSVPGNP